MWWEDVDRFLSAHKNTLVNLTIEDSMLMEQDWAAILLELIGSMSLRSLKLFQLTENFWRIRFPTTSKARASVEGHDNWSWVTQDQYMATVLPCEGWSERLSAIINDMELSDTPACHGAEDAAYWR
jgi:hypothetical protein